MGIENARALVEEVIDKAGGCAVIDGGLATQLENHGASINDPLWSALCLLEHPNLIKRVHLEYLEAGADILVTSSYQATLLGFLSRGLSTEEAESVLKKSVALAIEARDQFWDAVSKSESGYNKALVAASIGSYGAYLADGSEYSGMYGKDVDVTKLKAFHRRRLQILAGAGPDLLAFETIPNKLETQWNVWATQYVDMATVKDFSRHRLEILAGAGPDLLGFETTPNKLETQAIVELLEEENIHIPSWICFSCVDGQHAASGESFKECLDIINESDKVAMAGINCAPPHFVESLICKFKKFTNKTIVVYPNKGEIWDGRAKKWLPSQCSNDEAFKSLALKWRDSGAKLIGGCCRTTPTTIRGISTVLKTRF
ncbi:hypothetical protein Cgig2_030347 [Carnegiea gigantea]|uniref:Hcy-binding domain-containing protein n=1 Tax=Carnegiea gigantea TaxID=171969 RepID=A0A9Q1QJ85_9CARY|nr:hypothetical protein Cgig2_030347 [Carnegiea gigantea]